MSTRPASLCRLLFCLVLLGMGLVNTLQAAERVALVIGNAAYTDGPLKNPVNDARAMDQKLTALGFKVQRVENLKRQQIGRTLNAFSSAIRPGDEVVVFYAGHGVQVKGINYLPAVDADIQSEDDVPLNSLNLNALMDRLDDAKAGLKLLFLDACRNNPYARSFRSGDRGLARVSAAPSGTLIHFATRPGSVAADGSGVNGLYTSQLLRYMDVPNVPVEIMLKRVSTAVENASQGAQEPWTEGSIRGEFYFRLNGDGAGVQVASLRPELVSVRGDQTGKTSHQTTEVHAADTRSMDRVSQAFGQGVSVFKLGMSPDQVNALLPQPFGSVSWASLPIAEEYKTTEVRYLHKPLKALTGLPHQNLYVQCGSGQSYLTFLFDRSGLFRISLRFWPDCPSRLDIIRQMADIYELTLVTANGKFYFRQTTPDIVFAGFGNASGEVSSLEWARAGGPRYEGQTW